MRTEPGTPDAGAPPAAAAPPGTAGPAAGAAPPAAPPAGARFVTGSVFRHVAGTTLTGSLGLLAIFAVDLLSLLYVSRLGDAALTAAVGYATNALFFGTSACIGLMIAVSALVSRAVGGGDRAGAKRLAASTITLATVGAFASGFLVLAVAGPMLTAFGATGASYDVALRYLWIALPSTGLMGLGMAYAGVLRAVGDAKGGMWVTVGGGLATAVADPILIFGLGLGVDGAAIATVLSRVAFVATGYALAKRHDILQLPTAEGLRRDLMPMLRVAVPAILTNLAAPFANALMVRVMAPYGDAVVAANAVIGRLVPVVFGPLFALSGAVGPVLGQNWGAGKLDRVREGLTASLKFAALATLLAWAALALAQGVVVWAFDLTGEAEALVRLFCLVIAGTWLGHGALFVANAAFNNLGAPLLSTGFNWGKATVGTWPFAAYGATMAGPTGALYGQGLGGLVFGLAGVAMAYRVVGRLRALPDAPAPARPPLAAPARTA